MESSAVGMDSIWVLALDERAVRTQMAKAQACIVVGLAVRERAMRTRSSRPLQWAFCRDTTWRYEYEGLSRLSGVVGKARGGVAGRGWKERKVR